MNRLSSLLEWIGATIGANPNTLKTTSKTLVGSINETNDSLDDLREVVRGIKYKNVDSSTVTISGDGTGTFTGKYTVPFTYQPFLTGIILRATGTNYNRVFLYGGSAELTNAVTGEWTFTCYGRNTGSSSASGLSVRFKVLLLSSI